MISLGEIYKLQIYACKKIREWFFYCLDKNKYPVKCFFAASFLKGWNELYEKEKGKLQTLKKILEKYKDPPIILLQKLEYKEKRLKRIKPPTVKDYVSELEYGTRQQLYRCLNFLSL